MHGQFPRNAGEELVENEQSSRWLKFGDIKGEAESTIVAVPGQAIGKNYLKNKILKVEINSKFRSCKQQDVTINLLTSESPVW
jgi:hypothetical protein